MNKLIIFIFVVCTPLFSYLDPGTGSMLLSSVVALVATFLYSAKSFFYNIVSFYNKIFHRQSNQAKSSIVFYNEGNQYFSTFYPVLQEMINRNIDFSYLYSNQNDLIIQSLENINSHFIGVGNKAFLYLNTLEADICIMTTPSLDIFQIKRSAGVKHYMHLHHATSGTAGYKVFSTDCFDSVLVPNTKDKELIRGIEMSRGINKKNIEVIGTPYLDYYFKQLEQMNISKNDKTTILISPTWGEHGLLYKNGFAILEGLLTNKKLYVIIRPHPQSALYEKEMLDNLKNKFINNQNLEWDYNNDALSSMNQANIMLSDFSGIIFDFIFLFNKPVLTMPSEFNYDGKDYISRDINLWHIDFFLKHTKVINESDINNLQNLILKLSNKNDNQEQKNNLNPFFTKSASKTVSFIEKISENIGGTK